MNSTLFRRRSYLYLLFFSLFVALAGPSGLVTDAEAARSKDKKKISKLKKTVRKLKRQLAVANRPIPVPAPFIEMVKVGDEGNATDAGNTSEASVYGAVPYEFQIGKYEVSLDEYTAFLNAVAGTDTYGLYDAAMATDLNIAGIQRNGIAPNFSYTVFGSGDRPVTNVSWFDAARFCNWLHNGRPTGAQDADTTERGAYTLDGATTGIGFERVWAAKYWIPSEDEWYKAAYHQPSGEGGDADDYWLYPTRSNSPPGNDIGPLPLENQANHFDGSGYSVTQSGSYDGNQNYLTSGGAYGGSASFYGTFDQGGNVLEWTDAVVSGSSRNLRGGSWFGLVGALGSSDRSLANPGFGNSYVGFRIASP